MSQKQSQVRGISNTDHTFQHFLARVPDKLQQLHPTQLGKEVQNVVRNLVKVLNVDQGVFFEFTPDGNELRKAYSHSVGGVRKYSPIIPNAEFPWYTASLRAGRTIVLGHVPEDLPPEALNERKQFTVAGIKSHLALPFKIVGSVTCIMALGTVRSHFQWDDTFICKARLIGEIMANALARRWASEVIAERERDCRCLLDYTYDWEYWENPDGSLRYVSPSCYRLSGYRASDFIQKPGLLRRIIVEEDKRLWDSHHANSHLHLKPQQIRFRIRTRNGDIRWIEHRCQPVPGPRCCLGFRANNHDITEQKLTEDNLCASQARVQILADALPVLISYVDAEQRYQFANKGYSSWFGLTYSSIHGRCVWDVLGRRVYRTLQPHIEKALSGKQVTFEELVEYPRLGRRYVRATYIPDERNGKVQGFYALVWDMEERKQTEQVLREKDKILREAESIGNLGSYEWDLANGTLRPSDGAYRILGCRQTGEDVRLEEVLELIHPEDRQAVTEWHKKLLMGTTSEADIEYRIMGSDGSERHIHHRGEIFRNEAGSVNRAVVIVCDITARKAAENGLRIGALALQQSQDDLRTLAGRILSAEEDGRRRIARELHDYFAQKLAFIAIEAGKLERRIKPALKPSLQKLSRDIFQLSTDVHGLSRRLHPSILDDLGLVKAIESECLHFLQTEGLRVRFVPEGIPDKLPYDTALSLYRIVQEGLKNIVKHAKTKDACVSMCTQSESIWLFIYDRGIGFNLVKVKGKGGLGLVSMDERVRAINGSILIASSPTEGTSITVRVPLREKDDEKSSGTSGR